MAKSLLALLASWEQQNKLETSTGPASARPRQDTTSGRTAPALPEFRKLLQPSTSLTSTNSPFAWTPWSLHHTPALQFMLEVDTSDSGVSVVPS